MKKPRLNLTVRIFLMTSALMLLACALACASIAYLTPITYTAILKDELDQMSRKLIEQLEHTLPGEGKALFDGFTMETGAKLTVWNQEGAVLYTGPSSSGAIYILDSAVGAEQEARSAEIAMVTEGSALEAAPASCALVGGAMPVAESKLAYAMEGQPGGVYPFSFSDGTRASMQVSGGSRAVNQATEAISRVMPFLAGLILLISIAGSFFYARYITRPIVTISRIARRIAALDFEARWTKHRNDEIGALGGSLNALSDNLSQALRQLQDANLALQKDIDHERELDRQRLAFFSAASHELKTPVTILKGQLSGMLAQVGIYRDREKYLARALEVTGRMESLVKEILTISQVESGSFSLSAKELDLGRLVQEQLELDQELIEQKNLRLETSIEPGAVLRGDARLLAKALDNVIINAIHYSPCGESLYIQVNDRFFSIENTGVHIPGDMLPQLFAPFFRVEQSRSRVSGGSGLGLYLVRLILDRHNAVYKIENTRRGVCFSAQFP